MPLPINEVDVDYEAQIQEIRRLISTTGDSDRRLVLEEQLRELELLSIQNEQPDGTNILPLSARAERRKSFRPASARPRGSMLTSLAEDKEVHLTTTPFQDLGLQRSVTMASLVLDVMASSVDEHYAPASVLSTDHTSFWMTSGLFPQTLRLTLREPVAVREVEVTCRYIRRLQIRTAPSRTNSSKKMAVVETELPASESSQLTTHSFAIHQHEQEKGERVEVIEVGVESAYNDFALVYVVRFRQAEPDADADAGENG